MPKPRTDTKKHILGTAYNLFYREGFSRVSVDAIAGAANITKRTIYYHFKSKDDILSEALYYQHVFVLSGIKDWAGDSPTSPAELTKNLFDALEQWAGNPRWLGSGFTRMAMEMAHMPGHPARATASRHKAAIENWLMEQFELLAAPEPQQLARQIMLLIEGSLSLILIHGDPDYAVSAGRAARKLIAQHIQT